MLEAEDTQIDYIEQFQSQYELDLSDSKNDMQLVAIANQEPHKEDGSPDFTISDEKESIIRSISSESSDHGKLLFIFALNYPILFNFFLDPFNHLPPNWINFDFKRKKSCLLSSIYSTCVTKAINHLEALQNAIDSW